MHRPVGITILGWLAIVWGILAFAIGVLSALIGLSATATAGVALNSGLTAGAAEFSAGLLLFALSTLAAILGLCDLVFGIGALRLARWAWLFGRALMVATIIVDVTQAFSVRNGALGSLIGAAFAAAVLYYLYRPEVRSAFGRTGATPPPAAEAQ